MNNPKNLWDILQQNIKQPIDKEKLKDVAKEVNPGIQDNEQQLRELVRKLAAVAGIRLTPEKEADILTYLKQNKFTGIDSIQKLFKKK